MPEMQSIHVTRYKHPKATGWAGYIEPADKSWIAFVGLDGRPIFFLHRDPETGAILGDDPEKHAEDIAALRREGGLRTGMVFDGSSVPEPGTRSPHELGERIIPLGVDGGGGDVEPLPA